MVETLTPETRARLREALATLRQVASDPNVTRGPRRIVTTGLVGGILKHAVPVQQRTHDQMVADANLSAACDPDTILALLAALDEAEKRAEAAEKRARELEDGLTSLDRVLADTQTILRDWEACGHPLITEVPK